MVVFSCPCFLFGNLILGWANWKDCCSWTLYGFWCIWSYSTLGWDEGFQGHCCREQWCWCSYISGKGSMVLIHEAFYLSAASTLFATNSSRKKVLPNLICWTAGSWLWTRRRSVWGDTRVDGEATREKINVSSTLFIVVNTTVAECTLLWIKIQYRIYLPERRKWGL